jgi:hypothetical protein
MTHGVRGLLLSGLIAAATACAGDDGDGGSTNADSAANTGDASSTTDGPGATSVVDGTGTTDASGGSSEAGTDGLVTNDCGTFDPNQPGDGVIPQDPDDPEILDACNGLCAVWLAVPNCTTDAAACLETCRLRSCSICPGTLAPLVDCEAASFVEDGCTCGPDGLQCEVPDACSELQAETGYCGG